MVFQDLAAGAVGQVGNGREVGGGAGAQAFCQRQQGLLGIAADDKVDFWKSAQDLSGKERGGDAPQRDLGSGQNLFAGAGDTDGAVGMHVPVQVHQYQLDIALRREPGTQPEVPVAHQLCRVVDAADGQPLSSQQIEQSDDAYRYEKVVAQVFKAGIDVVFGGMDVQHIGHGGISSYSATRLQLLSLGRLGQGGLLRLAVKDQYVDGEGQPGRAEGAMDDRL